MIPGYGATPYDRRSGNALTDPCSARNAPTLPERAQTLRSKVRRPSTRAASRRCRATRRMRAMRHRERDPAADALLGAERRHVERRRLRRERREMNDRPATQLEREELRDRLGSLRRVRARADLHVRVCRRADGLERVERDEVARRGDLLLRKLHAAGSRRSRHDERGTHHCQQASSERQPGPLSP